MENKEFEILTQKILLNSINEADEMQIYSCFKSVVEYMEHNELRLNKIEIELTELNKTLLSLNFLNNIGKK